MEVTGKFEIEFNADASTAKDALNDFMNEIRSIQEQYGESDVLTSLSDYASGGLEEANDILTEYQDLYNQAKQAELFSDKQQYSGKTALEWLNKYEYAVNKYNEDVYKRQELWRRFLLILVHSTILLEETRRQSCLLYTSRCV